MIRTSVRRALRAFLCAGAAVLAAPAVAPAADAPAPPRKFVLAGACRSIDPALVRGPDEERVVLACFEGLTVVDPATGELKPGAAASWTTSPDGKRWTFTLRDAKWQKKFGDGFEDKGTVKASDFVFAWMRLLDPALRSPHVHLLDVLTGVKPLSTDKPRANALDRIVTDLIAAIGGEDKKKTMSPDEVQTFLLDRDRNVRGWLGDIEAKEAREFVKWPANQPYQGPRAMALVKVLRAARDAALAAAGDAESHVGVDRGFFAPDEKTLVVEVSGPSPWLPSLLARAPLVPVNERVVTSKRDWAFLKAENQICNGRFVAASDFRPQGAESDSTGDTWAIKVSLHKNAKHHDAARTASDRVTILVDNGADEVLRQYSLGDVHWILTEGITLEVSKQIRASTAAGWKADPKVAAQRYFAAAAADTYDLVSGRMKILRFRCAAPLDKKEARVAVASLVSRADLAKRASSVVPPTPVTRFVHPRTTGATDLPRTPSFDAGKAKGLYGKRRFPEGDWARILCDPADDQVADAVGKAWKTLGDDAATTVLNPADLRVSIDAGLWDVYVQGFIADYDDPLAFLDPFTTKNPAGDCVWSHPLYDALIAGARDVAGFKAKPDAAAAAVPAIKDALGRGDLEGLRRALLAEAEAILLEEAIVVPLWIPVDSGIVAKGVRGLPVGPTSGKRSLLDVVQFPFATKD
jgi:ABC-type oligopeptide transport system substrate-binding subunit